MNTINIKRLKDYKKDFQYNLIIYYFNYSMFYKNVLNS